MSEMVEISKLNIGDTVTFNCYGLNDVPNVVNGILQGISSGNNLKYPSLAAVNHANIYSSLPSQNVMPVPNDYTKYNYLVIRMPDNSILEFGIPWIQPNSVSRLLMQTATVVIKNFDSSLVNSLSNLLMSNGYSDITISLS